MTTMVTESGYAAWFFPTGSTVDVCGSDMRVKETHLVLLAVWRSDGTTKLYLDEGVPA